MYNNLYDKMDNVKIVNSKGGISFVGDILLADIWYVAPCYDEGDTIISRNDIRKIFINISWY